MNYVKLFDIGSVENSRDAHAWGNAVQELKLDNTGCIRRPAHSAFLIFRHEYVEIIKLALQKVAVKTDDGTVACMAVLLAYFESWHNHNVRSVANGERKQEGLLQGHTIKDLINAACGLPGFSRNRILRSIKLLAMIRFIGVYNSPYPARGGLPDNSNWYLFKVDHVQNALDAWDSGRTPPDGGLPKEKDYYDFEQSDLHEFDVPEAFTELHTPNSKVVNTPKHNADKSIFPSCCQGGQISNKHYPVEQNESALATTKENGTKQKPQTVSDSRKQTKKTDKTATVNGKVAPFIGDKLTDCQRAAVKRLAAAINAERPELAVTSDDLEREILDVTAFTKCRNYFLKKGNVIKKMALAGNWKPTHAASISSYANVADQNRLKSVSNEDTTHAAVSAQRQRDSISGQIAEIKNAIAASKSLLTDRLSKYRDSHFLNAVKSQIVDYEQKLLKLNAGNVVVMPNSVPSSTVDFKVLAAGG